MEKQNRSIASSKYICSALENVTLNSNISLAQIKEILNVLDTASYALIVPILKLQYNFNCKYSIIADQLRDLKAKQDLENNDNTANSEDTKSENNENSKKNDMIEFCEGVKNSINLISELSHSESYENIIKAFNEIIPDSGMFFETSRWYSLGGKNLHKSQNQEEEKKEDEKEEEDDKEGEEEEEGEDADGEENKENTEKENEDTNMNQQNLNSMPMPHSSRLREKLLNNKNKINNINNNSNKNNHNFNNHKNKKSLPAKKKSNHNNSHLTQNKETEEIESHGLKLPPPPKWTNKQKKEIDLLRMIQRDYPSNSYVQKISKTCLSRRLFKKIMYQHIFNYYENGNVDDKKVKSSGESACYKNCKTTFKFSDDKIKNIDKINEMMAKEFKQEFTKVDNENKEYIIAGKIGCQIYELITRIFKRNLLKEFSIVNATLEFYEFYEELTSEFNEKEKNVKILMCDNIVLKQLRQDWKNLCLCRDYVRKKKAENAI